MFSGSVVMMINATMAGVCVFSVPLIVDCEDGITIITRHRITRKPSKSAYYWIAPHLMLSSWNNSLSAIRYGRWTHELRSIQALSLDFFFWQTIPKSIKWFWLCWRFTDYEEIKLNERRNHQILCVWYFVRPNKMCVHAPNNKLNFCVTDSVKMDFYNNLYCYKRVYTLNIYTS